MSEEAIRELRIERMILHEVGPKAEDFRLYNGLLPPGDSEEFFLARIAAANQGSAYRFTAASRVEQSFRRASRFPAEFEAIGKELATTFQSLHHGAANPGTLAVFQIASQDRTYFAIVKFDNQRVVALAEGLHEHALITLLRKTIVEAKDAMQMSAVVALNLDGGSLAVRARRKGQRISDYFIEFLGAERLYSERELTKNLADALKETARAQPDHVDPLVKRELMSRIHNALAVSEEFDPEDDAMLTAVFGAPLCVNIS